MDAGMVNDGKLKLRYHPSTYPRIQIKAIMVP